jgi:hypothetical protein
MLSTGSCYCHAITYEVSLNSPDDARTSLCHCQNCKVCTHTLSLSLLGLLAVAVSELNSSVQKFTGCNFGITSKIPKSAFKIRSGSEHVRVHEADNGSGVVLHREFCDTCGSGLLEYGVRYSSSSSRTFLDLPVCLRWRLFPFGGRQLADATTP